MVHFFVFFNAAAVASTRPFGSQWGWSSARSPAAAGPFGPGRRTHAARPGFFEGFLRLRHKTPKMMKKYMAHQYLKHFVCSFIYAQFSNMLCVFDFHIADKDTTLANCKESHPRGTLSWQRLFQTWVVKPQIQWTNNCAAWSECWQNKLRKITNKNFNDGVPYYLKRFICVHLIPSALKKSEICCASPAPRFQIAGDVDAKRTMASDLRTSTSDCAPPGPSAFEINLSTFPHQIAIYTVH